MNVLDIRDLNVRYHSARGTLHAVSDVSLHVAPGETLGLVGESGCGKSSLGKAVMRLLEPDSGSIHIQDTDITHLSARQLRPLRRAFQMVFQDPGGSLDPRQSVQEILSTPLRLTRPGLEPGAMRLRVSELLKLVGLPDDVAHRLPHEFSGGQRQRIAIARALAPQPGLIVCDEPVSALDVSLQAQILNLLADLQQKLGMAYLFISHDLGVVQHLADRVAVMYLGRIVETGPRQLIWKYPAHPYTRALISAAPSMAPHRGRRDSDDVIQGDLPDPYQPPSGCSFHTRCPASLPACATTPAPWVDLGEGHEVSCHAPNIGRTSTHVLQFVRRVTETSPPLPDVTQSKSPEILTAS